MTTLPQSKYNKDRPFLIVTTYRSPAKNVRTERKGWVDHDENWQVHEQRAVATHISRTNLRQATVIIDVINRTCVKNRYSDDAADVVAHYLSKFQAEVTQAMELWVRREAIKRARATA